MSVKPTTGRLLIEKYLLDLLLILCQPTCACELRKTFGSAVVNQSAMANSKRSVVVGLNECRLQVCRRPVWKLL